MPPGSVVVRVSHCAVHWVDCLMMAGQYQQAPPLPYTPGEEYSVPSTVTRSTSHTGEFPKGVGHRVENGWGLTKVAVVLLNGLIW